MSKLIIKYTENICRSNKPNFKI